MLDVAMPTPSDSAANEMSSQFHRPSTGCFSLEQLRDLYPDRPHARAGAYQDRAQARGSPLNPRHGSSADPSHVSGSGSRVVILRSPLDSLERRRSPGSPSSPQHHHHQQQHPQQQPQQQHQQHQHRQQQQHQQQQHRHQHPQQRQAQVQQQQCAEQPVQLYMPEHALRLQRAGGGGSGSATRRLSQDGGRRPQRPYASPPSARRAASEAATPELRLDAEVALQFVRGMAKSRLGQQAVQAPHRRCSSEVPLTDADADADSCRGRGEDDSVEIFFFDAPSKSGGAHGAGEQAPSLADCWPMAGRGEGREPGTPEVYEGHGPRPSSSEGSLAPAQSCPAEMESGQARMPSVDSLRPSMFKSASVSEPPSQEQPRKLKTLRSILVEREGKLQHANSLGRRVRFKDQVEVFVYL